MRCFAQIECSRVAETAVGFKADAKILAADVAIVGGGSESQRTVDSNGIAELPRLMGHVFLDNKVFRKIPSPPVATEQQLALDFTLLLLTSNAVGLYQIRFCIVSHHLQQCFVCAVD